MPNIFLSPSLQTGNYYAGGGTEAQYMGYVADALEPYLRANNITYTRSKLPNTLANAIRTSNAGNYDLHLALHSNAAPEGREGQFRGIQGYYYPTSQKGKKAAQDLTDSLKNIYPDPELVYTVPTTTIAEVRKTKAPAVLMEIGYHDNSSDAQWIKNNIQNIARALAMGLTVYFSLPFKDVCVSSGGKISTDSPQTGNYVRACTNDSSPLNIREQADRTAALLGQIPAGEKAILIDNPQNGWAKIRYNAVEGYASADYLCVCNNEGGTGKGIVQTGGSNLNLRSAPSLTANIIGRIPDGATVNVLGTHDAWLRVNYMGATGYVLSDFIKRN